MKLLKSLFIILLLCCGKNVESQTICKDTSERFSYGNDSTTYELNSITQTNSENLLLGGMAGRYGLVYRNSGLLLKIKKNGDFVFGKYIDSLGETNQHSVQITKSFELKDKNIVSIGIICDGHGPKSEYNLICKSDSNCNIIWTTQFKYKDTFDFNDIFSASNIVQDSITSDIFICGNLKLGKFVCKIENTTGKILWSKNYLEYSDKFSQPFGIINETNYLNFFYSKWNSSEDTFFLSRQSIDKLNGDTIKYDEIKLNNSFSLFQFWNSGNLFNSVKKISKNSFILSAHTTTLSSVPIKINGVSYYSHSFFVEIDSNFDVINSYAFLDTLKTSLGGINISNMGNIFSYWVTISGNTRDINYVNSNNKGVIKDSRLFSKRNSYLPVGFLNEVDNKSQILVSINSDTVANSLGLKNWKIEYLKMSLNDTSSNCLGNKITNSKLYSLSFSKTKRNSVRAIWSDVVYEVTPKITLSATPFILTKSPTCYQTSYCDTLKLIANNNITCLSSNIIVVTHKNRSCGSNIFWQYDTSAISNVISVNDSLTSFGFKKVWAGYIYGSIQGCSTITDSIYIQVLQSPASLNLGTDFKICPNSKTTLNAHSGYANYKWQDGSTDSTYSVTQAGTYFIETTDACGGRYSDTINISYFLPLPTTKYDTLKGCNSVTRNGITYTSTHNSN